MPSAIATIPEFQRDMLTTVEHVVGRMNQLMLQLRTGADARRKAAPDRPRSRSFGASARAQAGQRAPIDLELAPGLLALGHEDRLDHVIGHLIQNALDATAGGGRVRVRLLRDDALRGAWKWPTPASA